MSPVVDGRARRVDFGQPTLVLRSAGLALRWPVRSLAVCAVMAVLTAAVTTWALMSGDYPLTPVQVWQALIDDPGAGFARIVVVEWRLPRAVAAITFGFALGAAGAVFQSLTRNPLASPDIIGFTAGAYTGALVVIIVIGGTYLQVTGGALVGGVVAALVVYLLAWRSGVQGFRLIIVGIGITAMLASFNAWLILGADLDVAMSAAAWGTGSLTDLYWPTVTVSGAMTVVLLVLLGALGPGLRTLDLGDDAARALGTRTELVRLTAVLLGLALTATVTAAAGPIAFVALAAPQIGRRLARTPGVTLGPAVFTGGFLLACADQIAQNLLPRAVPVGVLTIVIGGSYLVWLIIREVRGSARP